MLTIKSQKNWRRLEIRIKSYDLAKIMMLTQMIDVQSWQNKQKDSIIKPSFIAWLKW